MVDRAQPGAIDSIIRGDELRQIFGRFSDGFIVPGNDPTPAAQRRGDIDASALDAFSLTTSQSVLDVTVAPGEGFVGGWFCRDRPTTVTRPANTTVDIVVGFNDQAIFDPNTDADRDDADEVIVDLARNVDDALPTTVAHRVTTDGSGVVSSERIARVGSSIQVESVSATDISTDSLAATTLSSSSLTNQITDTQLDTINGFVFNSSVEADSIVTTDVSTNSLTATTLSSSSLTDQITDTQLNTSSGFFNFAANDVRVDTGRAIETPSAERVGLGANTVLSANDGTREFVAHNDDTAAGRGAGNNTLGETAFGFKAARTNSKFGATAFGANALEENTGQSATAGGVNAGQENDGRRTTLYGASAGQFNSGDGVIGFGFEAAKNNSQDDIMIITNRNGTRRMELDLSNGDLSIEGSLNQNAQL